MIAATIIVGRTAAPQRPDLWRYLLNTNNRLPLYLLINIAIVSAQLLTGIDELAAMSDAPQDMADVVWPHVDRSKVILEGEVVASKVVAIEPPEALCTFMSELTVTPTRIYRGDLLDGDVRILTDTIPRAFRKNRQLLLDLNANPECAYAEYSFEELDPPRLGSRGIFLLVESALPQFLELTYVRPGFIAQTSDGMAKFEGLQCGYDALEILLEQQTEAQSVGNLTLAASTAVRAKVASRTLRYGGRTGSAQYTFSVVEVLKGAIGQSELSLTLPNVASGTYRSRATRARHEALLNNAIHTSQEIVLFTDGPVQANGAITGNVMSMMQLNESGQALTGSLVQTTSGWIPATIDLNDWGVSNE